MTPMTTEQPATDAAPKFRIEPANAESLAYVLSTWGRTLETKLEAIPQPGFLKAFAPIQARIIKRSTVLTALTADGRIAAFCIYEPGVLHWVSTRKELRRQHAAAYLLATAGLVTLTGKPIITTWTSDLRHLGLADAPYTPFWLRN